MVKSAEQNWATPLNMRALQQTPGFLLRMAQLKFFEGFYEHFAESGITPATYAILVLIRDNPSILPSTLAGGLRLRLPNLIKLLNELESTSLIQRKRSKADRRAVELLLTAKGQRLIQEAAKMAKPYERLMLAALSQAEQDRLIEFLNRIVPL
jgi:DNA-binding MarR family transcriptional regulator